jgi:hypothetical protein
MGSNREGNMAGTDTIQGIAWQQAATLLRCIDVVKDPQLGALRVEGVDDVIDFETLGADGRLIAARQAKTRVEPYTWGREELLKVIRRWLDLPAGNDASFEFLTDGSLGPSGVKVRNALQATTSGDFTAIEALLGQSLSPSDRARLARTTVTSRAPSVAALFNQAEYHLAALLPAQPTAQQALEVAGDRINALYRTLFERGGDPQPDVRLLTREQLATILGVDLTGIGDDRWDAQLRDAYLAAVTSPTHRDPVVDVTLVPTDLRPPVLRPLGDPSFRAKGDERLELSAQPYRGKHDRPAQASPDEMVLLSENPLPLSTLLEIGPAALLAAPTGAGKSTALMLLRAHAASLGSVVVIVPAEDYTPGRLAIAAAGAVGRLLERPLGTSVGYQVLADPTVTVAIDGVSEMPIDYVDALVGDLRLLRANGAACARICVVGRDAGALRSVMPGTEPAAYTLAAFDSSARDELTRSVFAEKRPDLHGQAVLGIRLRIERALGAGASNPLLYTMGLNLALQNREPTSRADLYRQCIEGMAARSRTRNVEEITPVLGMAFTQLLNEGRRYTDRYTWRVLLAEAVSIIERRVGVALDPTSVYEGATRAGLVVPAGATGLLAASHDSLADYLAGFAHGRGLAELPTALAAADAERVVFAADVGGVSDELAIRVIRDLPLLAVRVAEHDHAGFNADAPHRIADLLETVAGPLTPDPPTVQLWRDTAAGQPRVLACMGGDVSSYWVTEPARFSQLLTQHGVTAVAGGPLAAAVRLWETRLTGSLRWPPAVLTPHPRSQKQARAAVIAHATDAAQVLEKLISTILSPRVGQIVRNELGPVGLHGYIGSFTTEGAHRYYPLSYRRDHNITVVLADDSRAAVDATGQTTVEALLDVPPAADAARQLREAIKRLVGRDWPRS